ncbi:MAG: peptidyl-prolyl cis-trans isomerase [Clostridia bacterium]|nr:peptidyl-prolyl cis-trans isomerase [Clostridia bacterium]
MKIRHFRAAAVLFACILVLGLTGCGSADPDRQAAKVNDTVITQGQLENFSILYMYTLGYDPNEITDEEKSTILQQMVDTEVLRQYFEGLNGENIYGDSFEDDMKKFLDSAKSSEKDFLDKYSITDEDIEYLYRANYLNSTLYTQIQNEHAETDLIARAEEYYDQHKDEYATDPEVRFSVIRVAEQEKAEDIKRQLDGGADFANLAKQYSDESASAANGGDIGFYTRAQVTADYSDKIFDMEVGSVSEPIEADKEFMIFKVTDRNDSGFKSFDEVRDDIYYSFIREYYDQKLDEMKEGCKIEIN